MEDACIEALDVLEAEAQTEAAALLTAEDRTELLKFLEARSRHSYGHSRGDDDDHGDGDDHDDWDDNDNSSREGSNDDADDPNPFLQDGSSNNLLSQLCRPNINMERLVDEEIAPHLERWRDLDARKIPLEELMLDRRNRNMARASDDEEEGENDGDGIPTNTNKMTKLRLGWKEANFVLPENFDYKSTRGAPTEEDIQNNNEGQPHPREKVVALSGGVGAQADYEAELWSIFNDISTETELRLKANNGIGNGNDSAAKKQKLGRGRGLRKEADEKGNSTNEPDDKDNESDKQKATAASTSRSASPLFHAMAYKPISAPNKHAHARSSRVDVEGADNDKKCKARSEPSGLTDDVTIRFEFWKRRFMQQNTKKQQQTQFNTNDDNKLELEFHGDQTLLDVHEAIRSQTRDVIDVLLIRQQQEQIERVVDGSERGREALEMPSISSGMFFMEDTFYITGDEDYSVPILNWLKCKDDDDDNDNSPQAAAKGSDDDSDTSNVLYPRDSFLGISLDQVTTKQMKDQPLKSLPLRLGVRYLHVFAGNLQTSVFVTNVRPVFDDEWKKSVPKEHFPVLLKPWSLSPNHWCKACGRLQAVVICLDDELTDGSATPLCTSCHHSLHYDSEGRLRYDNFKVYPIELLSQGMMSVDESHTASLL
jgi:hypothetical protein